MVASVCVVVVNFVSVLGFMLSFCCCLDCCGSDVGELYLHTASNLRQVLIPRGVTMFGAVTMLCDAAQVLSQCCVMLPK